MQRRLYQELLWALLGYVVTVFVSAFVCSVAVITEDYLPGHIQIDEGFDIKLSGLLFLMTAVLIAISSWPGFIMSVAVARWRGYSSLSYFTICGVGAALLAVAGLVAAPAGRLIGLDLFQEPAIYLGGIAGGFAYGLFVRRYRVFLRPLVKAEIFD
ncbi:hypothetical protein [Roseibium aggregatum]|uniref:Uncharacterized protein n=1 Tax=Roseibium aggregatum TaxID=187304 RepID=A0A926NZG3_9HYPH|nr:hypothetical protein [Roseibium aggregatum]MBD1546945.1 hypothetical protein [Roseibium aggregatum]